MMNTVRDSELPADALLDAVNVNIRRDGTALTRHEWTQALEANAHSLFRHNGRAFGVLDGDLCELDATGATPLMAGAGRLNWTILNDDPVFVNHEGVFVVHVVVEPVSLVERDEFDLDNDLVPMPGGQWIEYWNGRLVVARGRTVIFSEPLRYGAHNPLTGYIQLGSRIEWMASLDEGIYVGMRDEVLYLDGPSPAEMRSRRVAGRSAPGMALTVHGENLSPELAVAPKVAVFFTPSGFTLGLPSGQVVYPQSAAIRNLPLFRGTLIENGGRFYAVRGL